jgi:hypothetical protein
VMAHAARAEAAARTRAARRIMSTLLARSGGKPEPFTAKVKLRPKRAAVRRDGSRAV